MFDNLKKFQQLKELKDALEKEKVETEIEGTRVVINGKMEIEEIRLNPALDQSRQEMILKDCINDSIKKLQKTAAQKMMSM